MFCILALGVYQAFKYFSGVDPVKLDPKTALFSLAADKGAASALQALFGFSFPHSLKDLSKIAKNPQEVSSPAQNPPANHPGVGLALRFAIVTDSHNDNEDLKKALTQANAAGAKFVIGLGDFTDVGTVEDLQKAKNVFLSSGLPFYVTAGDHDLWSARDKGLDPSYYFQQVFGAPYQSFSDGNIRFILLYNSDNYHGVDSLQMGWLGDELDRARITQPKDLFVFMQEPLYHPSSDHIMGKADPKLAAQASRIAGMLKGALATEIFAGDTHAFLRYSDPKTGLKMTTVGAITQDRNSQPPRFAIVDVYSDGSYNIQDVEVR